MSASDEREYGSDERAAETDDVEGHLLDAPPSERPPAEHAPDEDDDVEAHMLGDRPPSEAPPSD